MLNLKGSCSTSSLKFQMLVEGFLCLKGGSFSPDWCRQFHSLSVKILVETQT